MLSSTENQNTPRYIESFVGLPVFMAPYMQRNAQLSGMVFKADLKKLSDLCDKYLNQIENSEIRYTPLFSKAALIFAQMQIYSLNPE